MLLFEYFIDIFMDENVEEKKCMFIEMSVYQVMVKEFGDFILYDFFFMLIFEIRRLDFYFEEDVRFVDSWIDEILSGFFFVDCMDSFGVEVKFDIKYGSSFEEFYFYIDVDCGSFVWNDMVFDIVLYLYLDFILFFVDFGNFYVFENGSGGSL